MRYLFILIFSLSNLKLFAQRSYERDTSPLASGETVLKSVGYAICIFVVAYLMIKFSDSLKENGKETSLSTNVGCFGGILGFIGLIFLYPLLHWIEVIGLSIISFSIIAALAIFIVILVFNLVKSFFK